MEVRNKATSIDLFSLKTPQMRAFHMAWFSFFLCFFAWFGIAPLMAVVRDRTNTSVAPHAGCSTSSNSACLTPVTINCFITGPILIHQRPHEDTRVHPGR